jgi:hypothetical protein
MSQTIPLGKMSDVNAGITPGPWKANRCGELRPDDFTIVADLGPREDGIGQIRTIGRVASFRTGLAEATANARLIAASPDLLHALRKALNFIENTESEMGEALESGDIARAAIAKATGQS